MKTMLSEGRLERLIKKLDAHPIEKWKKDTHSTSYEPHPDSPSVGCENEYTIYTTSLDDFDIVLELNYGTGGGSGETYDYSLKVLNRKSILDEEEERDLKGPITKLFGRIDKKYERNQERTRKKQEQDISDTFEKLIM